MKEFMGRWKKDKKTGQLVWKWKRRKVKSKPPKVKAKS